MSIGWLEQNSVLHKSPCILYNLNLIIFYAILVLAFETDSELTEILFRTKYSDSPPCPAIELDNTTFTSITFSWTTPGGPLLLSYRIHVCFEGTSECPVQTNCSGCSSYEATDLSPNTSYTITVDSFISPYVDCVRQGCSLITGTTMAGVHCHPNLHSL